jgi:hypothetical protein
VTCGDYTVFRFGKSRIIVTSAFPLGSKAAYLIVFNDFQLLARFLLFTQGPIDGAEVEDVWK